MALHLHFRYQSIFVMCRSYTSKAEPTKFSAKRSHDLDVFRVKQNQVLKGSVGELLPVSARNETSTYYLQGCTLVNSDTL